MSNGINASQVRQIILMFVYNVIVNKAIKNNIYWVLQVTAIFNPSVDIMIIINAWQDSRWKLAGTKPVLN